MANFKKHQKTGAILGVVISALVFIRTYFLEKRRNPNHEFNWAKFLSVILSGCVLGAFTGILPDKFEPANHPNHRGFFHSIVFGIILVLILIVILKGKQNIIVKAIAIIGFAGYSSHLYLDSQTPKSLPTLGLQP